MKSSFDNVRDSVLLMEVQVKIFVEMLEVELVVVAYLSCSKYTIAFYFMGVVGLSYLAR